MTEQLLHRADVATVLQQIRGERMTMRDGRFGNTRLPHAKAPDSALTLKPNIRLQDEIEMRRLPAHPFLSDVACHGTR